MTDLTTTSAVYATLQLFDNTTTDTANTTTLAQQLHHHYHHHWSRVDSVATSFCADHIDNDDSSSSSSSSSTRATTVNVWIGTRGATAAGAKRWQLAPPSVAVATYPDIHPSARQAVLGSGDGGSAVVPVVDVVLRRGEALVIPAYYWHRVTTVDAVAPHNTTTSNTTGGFSVAINFWCEHSPPLAAYQRARDVPLPPINMAWPLPMRTLAVKLHVDGLVAKLKLPPTFVNAHIV
eukprot:CAMPEP_0198367816 /NCGR_PEP_ID=MMETSP1450-20131203/155381_1 /TAXON_ID=753684 ORGANISM="Madagascaria erythrocladiodes, Strain CCMP3234" /NCGR_SAMPLE_ID=MMETSP1450 /ASSEMBLY_ACC=CAM_ASM_001115 /LENGTH=234 /DNA_ID=CAMNT_0044075305 /DNA_START=134 /DNA_END=835 /DNA_ORIENTATION=+